MEPKAFIEYIVLAAESVGVLVIVLGTLVLSWGFVSAVIRGKPAGTAYHTLRLNLGRVILLGLEFFVAADIIRTVSARPNFQDLAGLGALVVIRTFLSFALEIEINGRLPWRMGQEVKPEV